MSATNETEEFKNWPLTQIIKLKEIFKPKNDEQVKHALTKVKSEGGKIRCCGAGHSWSPIFPDENTYLMDMSCYGQDDPVEEKIKLVYDYNGNGEPLFLNDVAKTRNGFVSTPIGVLIYPNVTTGDLANVLLQRGLALPCNVILPGVQYGGVVGTACHGVGQGLKSVSDYVTYVEMITANGDSVKFVNEDPTGSVEGSTYDAKHFSAAQGNLGLLGVVVRIGLSVQPTVMVSDENNFEDYSVGETFSTENDALKCLVTGNLSVEIFWFPFNSTVLGLPHLNPEKWKPENDQLWVKKINQKEQSDKEAMKPCRLSIREGLDDALSTIFSLISPLIQQTPSITPIYLNAAHYFVSKLHPRESCVMLPQAIHYQGGTEKLLVYDMEFAFPVKEDFSNVIEAANDVFKLVKENFDVLDYPLNIALEMRFMGTSDVLLCPAYKRENGYSEYTCYMEILSLAPKKSEDDSFKTYAENWKTFCRKVADRWMNRDEKPIPHWGKQWQILENPDNDIYGYIRKAYGSRIEKFKKAMNEYDPDKMFVNDAFEKVFFPEDESQKKTQKK